MCKDNWIYKIWIIIYPIIIYYTVLSICSLLITDNGVLATTLAGLLALPVFTTLFYKDKKKFNFTIHSGNIKPYYMILVIIAGITACIGLNFLITLIQLHVPFNDYADTAETIFTSHLILQLIGVGIIAPITEEFVFRGLIFTRLKRLMKRNLAIFISALLFGIYHGNVIQGIYAFIFGLILAFLYEKYGTITAPVQFHIAANITSLIVQQMNLEMDILMLIIVTIICLTILILILYLVNKNVKR